MKSSLLRLFTPLFVCISVMSFAQNITVKGTVRDAATSQPMGGVSVSVDRTNAGTVTDQSGNYILNVAPEATISFSYIGYISQQVNAGSRSVIDIDLQSATSQLQQVVVIGYGTQRKRDLTGSIVSIKGEDIAKQPNTNPVSSLQGRVAGLTIVNSGRAGSSPTVRIRGVNSTNNSDPLYVVDGVFQTNIDYLNPADIESIEILKDPSSIAIFGLQGGNGVIIVTTKRAARGRTRVTLQSSIGVQHVNHTIDVADANGFRKLYAAQLSNLGAAPFDYTNYTANTDWQSFILRDAMININGLTISNSSEKSTTLLSVGYNNQDGVLKYDNYKKIALRLNEEIRITDAIKVGADINGFNWVQQSPGADLNNALWAAPIVPVQIDAYTYYSMPSFQRAQVSNPVATMNRNTGISRNKGYRVVGSVFAEIKFLKDFIWRSSVYTDLGFNISRSYTPLPFTFVNLGEGAAPTTVTVDQTVKTGVSQTQAEFRKYQQDHTLTWTKKLASHQITALAGFTTLYTGTSNINGNRRDTTLNIPYDPDLWYLNIAQQANPGTYGGGGSEEAYMSFLGRVNYTFKSRYLLNVTYRRDGSSKFATDKRWANFGSVGAGWVISDENFFSNVNVIDFLKLRGSWGTVGNGLGTGSYLYQPVLNTSSVGVFGNNIYSSVSPAYVPDPNLHWETVRGADIGVELRLLKNKLSADIGVYDKKTKDILTTITLLGSAGSTSYFTNLGTIDNKGIEISLEWNDRIGKDLTYGISGNFSYNKNEVESIGNNINFQILGNNGVNKTETGQSIGYFYGYRQTGIYQATADLDKMAHMSNSLPGDIAYEDVNQDGIIDTKDRTYLGTPFPKINFGFNLSLGYKNFDLLAQGQGVAGNVIYTQRRASTFAILNYESNRLHAWTGAGTTNVEPVLDNTRANNFLFSSYFLEPGDYFRIRNIQLGYSFKAKMLSGSGIKQLRVYVSGQNIATITKATGYTPEASIGNPIASGADNGTYPVPAVYTFGINATF
jgi:TonB-linked SusC/RagA family outer membrane protein